MERSRRIQVSFQTETRFRFMYQPSYFFGDFRTYTFKYMNEIPHFAKDLYIGYNQRRFHFRVSFQVSIQVYMILNRHSGSE